MIKAATSIFGAFLVSIALVGSGHAAGESKLIAAVPTIKTDTASLKQAAAKGKAAGWSVPTSAKALGLDGTWKFTTHRKEKGIVVFLRGKVAYGSGKSSNAFTDYTIMSNKKEPTSPVLVVLKSGSKQVWYMPFRKGGQLTLLNIANKEQWLSFSK